MHRVVLSAGVYMMRVPRKVSAVLLAAGGFQQRMLKRLQALSAAYQDTVWRALASSMHSVACFLPHSALHSSGSTNFT